MYMWKKSWLRTKQNGRQLGEHGTEMGRTVAEWEENQWIKEMTGHYFRPLYSTSLKTYLCIFFPNFIQPFSLPFQKTEFNFLFSFFPGWELNIFWFCFRSVVILFFVFIKRKFFLMIILPDSASPFSVVQSDKCWGLRFCSDQTSLVQWFNSVSWWFISSYLSILLIILKRCEDWWNIMIYVVCMHANGTQLLSFSCYTCE